ncbi:hypothetical protein PHYSODRAFT_354207 [Phytophthora sojae]|uniref:ZSWIM1/3 RNaseH-like domain-containing protein n=1 Tax=Phytophthora sojae (strain P6497) TaxID=1094619 RepID=G4Z5S0_PHYSP|nr:hypothetical protein PHYSODRAFT_354207 [Phytophthora sojae]EGZ19503.1 hypothetical protein PHYSODRAFT_354207 [Phytophthora sojae]|eukprot:XP_009522220.1 hypothetical protein PHYSODRAFT_354207 [Phytophthora sojae]
MGCHLGTLMVTSPTGRGVPVLDFLAVDHQAETTEAILEFFKRQNNSWTQIETVVIDKDFTEWKVLLKCFPHAEVLLCQFHVYAYWKKLVKNDSMPRKQSMVMPS